MIVEDVTAWGGLRFESGCGGVSCQVFDSPFFLHNLTSRCK